MGCGASVNNNQPSIPTNTKNPNSNNKFLTNLDNQKTNANLPQKNTPTLNKKYLIKQLLGKGTYGQVYRCIDLKSQQQFALKIVKLTSKSKSQAQKQIKNLKSQISLLKKLSHPNVVKYYTFDVSEDNQTVEIVFELIQQGSLKDYMKKNNKIFTQKQAAKICKDILKGLQYLHENNIIHRDLKCANILITKDMIPKITDFGTAKQISIKTHQDISKLCSSLKGTPYYMAPQILKRSGHHKSADIWSFGCTLIQMLTGIPPWTSLTQNFQQIISYIVSGIHPPLPKGITKQCEFFLLSCLDTMPGHRLKAGELLRHRFITGGKNQDKIGKGGKSLVYESGEEKIEEKNQKKDGKDSRKENQSNSKDKNTNLMKQSKNSNKNTVVVDLNNSIQIKARKKTLINPNNPNNNPKPKPNIYKQPPNSNNSSSNNNNKNQNSEPFLNYYSAASSSLSNYQSQDHVSLTNNKSNSNNFPTSHQKKPQKKIKSAKRQSQGLKRTSKTLEYMKMTQENILNNDGNSSKRSNQKGWKQIEQEEINQYNMRKDKNYNNNHNNGSRLSNNKTPLKSHTQITQIIEQSQQDYQLSRMNSKQQSKFIKSKKFNPSFNPTPDPNYSNSTPSSIPLPIPSSNNIINTSYAIQQRNKYLQIQKRQKQRKQQQKRKWEQELKRQSERKRQEIQNRYNKLAGYQVGRMME